MGFLSAPDHYHEVVALRQNLQDDLEMTSMERLKPANDQGAH